MAAVVSISSIRKASALIAFVTVGGMPVAIAVIWWRHMAAIAVFSGIPTGTSNLEPSRYSLPALASLIGWSCSTIRTGVSFVPLVGRVVWTLLASALLA